MNEWVNEVNEYEIYSRGAPVPKTYKRILLSLNHKITLKIIKIDEDPFN